MTIHLRTLGQLHLGNEEGEELRGLLTQPKRLALLVYLSVVAADGRMCRRDALIEMFWPDAEADRARNTLRQSLHFIKQIAGVELFVTRGTEEVGLLPGAVVLDAARVEELAGEGRHADALAMYGGEFLAGFTVRGATAFEQWAAAERERLKTIVAESTGVVSVQPTPAIVETHGLRQRWMIGAAIAALVLVAAFFILRPAGEGTAAPTDPNRIVVLPFVVRGPESLRYLEDGLPILLDTRLDGAGAIRTVDARALIVHLGQARAAGPVDAVRARAVAEHFGAQLYVLGSIVGSPDRVHLDVSLYDRGNGADRVAHAEVEGAETELVSLVDKLAAALLAERFHETGGAIAETAARTTSSLPALKAWLVGEADITAGRYDAAVAALTDAIAADSNFAMAHFRLAVAADWAGRSGIVTAEADRAVALADRMNPSTRLVLLAFQHMRYGNYVGAGGALRKVLAEHPSSAEAWYEMGEVLFHGNPAQGKRQADAQTAFETALRLDPRNFSAIIHLSRIAASLGDTASLARLTRSAIDSNSDVAQRGELHLLRALGDASARRAFLAAPVSGAQLDAMWRVAEYTGNLAGAEAIADSMLARGSAPELRAGLLLIRAHLGMGREHFDRALSDLDSLARYAPQVAAVTRLLLVTHPALPHPLQQRLLARAAQPLPRSTGERRIYVASPTPDSVATQATMAQVLARLALGDSAQARAAAEAGADSPVLSSFRAELRLALAGDSLSRESALHAVAVADSLNGVRFAGQSAFAPRARFHLAVARAMAAQGRVADAIARLHAIPEDFGFNIAYFGELARQRAALEARVRR